LFKRKDKGLYAFTCAGHAERAVLYALDRSEHFSQSFDVLRPAPYRDNLEAIIVIQVDVLRGQYDVL
jgi:hypothetical protein